MNKTERRMPAWIVATLLVATLFHTYTMSLQYGVHGGIVRGALFGLLVLFVAFTILGLVNWLRMGGKKHEPPRYNRKPEQPQKLDIRKHEQPRQSEKPAQPQRLAMEAYIEDAISQVRPETAPPQSDAHSDLASALPAEQSKPSKRWKKVALVLVCVAIAIPGGKLVGRMLAQSHWDNRTARATTEGIVSGQLKVAKKINEQAPFAPTKGGVISLVGARADGTTLTYFYSVAAHAREIPEASLKEQREVVLAYACKDMANLINQGAEYRYRYTDAAGTLVLNFRSNRKLCARR